MPTHITRLTSLIEMAAAFELVAEAVRFEPISDLHRRVLGARRRKRRGERELRDEREVRQRLRMHDLVLFTRRADAVLRSCVESGELREPPDGERYSVYAMIPADQIVAVIDVTTDLGRGINDGSAVLHYDQVANASLATIKDPIERVASAAILDAVAVFPLVAPPDLLDLIAQAAEPDATEQS